LTRLIFAWGPSVAWAGVLFLSSAVPDWPYSVAALHLPDKALHFAVYSVLGATLAHGRFHAAPGVPHAGMVALGTLYGATDEWHQAYVPGRTPSVGDWAADVAGVAVGYTIAWLVASVLLRRSRAATKETTT